MFEVLPRGGGVEAVVSAEGTSGKNCPPPHFLRPCYAYAKNNLTLTTEIFVKLT